MYKWSNEVCLLINSVSIAKYDFDDNDIFLNSARHGIIDLWYLEKHDNNFGLNCTPVYKGNIAQFNQSNELCNINDDINITSSHYY